MFTFPSRAFRLLSLAAYTAAGVFLCTGGYSAARASSPLSDSTPVVETRSGALAGAALGPVDVFKGIPYAAPPVGKLRWRAPQPVAPWSGVRQAVRFGDDCMQDSAHNPLPPGHSVPQSEDCLYLNVWRPAGHGGEKLPVMVWVHGGGFIMGAGSLETYDGAALARKGVIVVTFNYRLGRFGNFVTPALLRQQQRLGEPAVNYWLMDQIAALRWVGNNIAGFGGDPGKVTVFGESAGAVSVGTLLAVPQARGLFQQAIMESGSPRSWLVPLSGSARSAEADGLRWSQAKGVASGDPEALRKLPAATVLDAPVTKVSNPVADGTLLKAPPARVFARGEAAPVRLLIGANDWEQALMRWLPGAGKALLQNLGPHAEEGLKLYGADSIGREKALERMWGDAAMVEPARKTAEMMARAGHPVWLYRFAYVPEALRDKRPGAGHGDEIEFVFATPSAASRPGWSAADQAMAEDVANRWVAFARTGVPDAGKLPHWPAFTLNDDALLEFGNSGVSVRRDFDRERLDFLKAHLSDGSIYEASPAPDGDHTSKR